MDVRTAEATAMSNPFELVTASKLSAADAVELWCDDKRVDRVKGKENCFINGHRGTGKSMLFRIRQHDCQILLNPNGAPDFVAVYLPVRDTEFITEEMELFQRDSQRNLVSESHFCVLITLQFVRLLQTHLDLVPAGCRVKFVELAAELYGRAFRFSTDAPRNISTASFEAFLAELSAALQDEQQRIFQYVGTRLYQQSTFNGPLFMFDTLLGPLADFMKDNTAKAVYVLVDDGDDLPESHTIVLNTWIARRHTSVVFKVSTMFGYKTFETRSRSAIQHPHDFFQFDIATRFLISDGPEDYVDLLRRICQKRLAVGRIETSPGVTSVDDFFPQDLDQKTSLAALADRLSREYEGRYTGRAVRDYVYRHLTSEYLKELNRRRSADSFVYSGFRTIALLSSGMVRDFIICAQRMYDNASRLKSGQITEIPPNVQSAVVRGYADEVLLDILNYKQKRSREATDDDWRAIHNLIAGLGNIYKAKMLSEDSERRVFSFAFQDEAGKDLERLLGWAVEEGYLMRGFISRKEGTGRRVLYVLTRRLAPAFNLDVSAYSGYLSFTSGAIRSLASTGPVREPKDAADQLALFEPVQVISSLANDSIDDASAWVPVSPEEVGL
jgi:hypothetical protein